MRIGAAALVVLGLTVGGCATITRGTSEQVAFSSEPAGARVDTSVGQNCITPCSLKIDRDVEFVATFSAPGYRPEQVQVASKIANAGAAGFAGNILVGGVIGMGVDAASGATLEHVPNPVVASLVPMALPSAQRRARHHVRRHRAPAHQAAPGT